MTETLLPRQNGTDKAWLEMKRAVHLPRRKLPLTCLGPLVGLLGAFTTLNFRDPVFAHCALICVPEHAAYLRRRNESLAGRVADLSSLLQARKPIDLSRPALLIIAPRFTTNLPPTTIVS